MSLYLKQKQNKNNRECCCFLFKKEFSLENQPALIHHLQYLRLLPFEGDELDLIIVFEANLESFHIAVITSPFYA